MGEVQLPVTVTRIQVIVPHEILSQKIPNWITAVSELKLALSGDSGGVFLT